MVENAKGDVTQLLVDWSNGDRDALDKLLPLVYQELHRAAGRYLRHERSDHTLQATALVNEAYLRLIDQRRVRWSNTLHFIAIAAQMMRRILADHARKRHVAKRGGKAERISLDDAPQLSAGDQPDLAEVDDALTELAKIDPQLSKIVELRYFGGLKSEEIAEFLGISVPTVTRRWRTAKAWLFRYMSGE